MKLFVAAEQEARPTGVFQAPAFYAKHGFEVVAAAIRAVTRTYSCASVLRLEQSS